MKNFRKKNVAIKKFRGARKGDKGLEINEATNFDNNTDIVEATKYLLNI